MIAIGGITLGLGYAANERRMKEFGKRELAESIVNGAIVGGMLLLFVSGGPVSTLINQAALSNGTTLSCQGFLSDNAAICFAYDYLASPSQYTYAGHPRESILTSTTTTMSWLLAANGALGLVAGLRLGVGFISLSFSSVLSPIVGEFQDAIELLGTISIAAVVQAAVLQFAAVATLTVLLPLGIVLRTFYPTRKLGGFFMAVSIGLYVVLPLSYVLNASITQTYSISLNQSGMNGIYLSASGLKDTVVKQAFQGTNSTSESQGTSLFSGITADISNIMDLASKFIILLLDLLSYLIVYMFILPAFSLVITAISIKELSGLLGAEVPFSSLKLV